MRQSSEPQWRKSSRSSHEGGNCVEVAELSGKIGVRDSKNPSTHMHAFERTAFRAFLHAVRTGRRHG
ncbi:DUF397 domain-containing protein [Actinocorallia populi]|uniref:DUF397 domain-containing protein n=1 Tax=Actinocorallia populi TaxID=2079200 RepID=UPI000D096EF7|nr:DUF397 domain-containing protein [Actinocorallia populi]